MTPAQVWVATLVCVHCSTVLKLCDDVLGATLSPCSESAARVAAALKTETTIELGKASLALVDGGANVLTAVRDVIVERRIERERRRS